MFNKIQIKRHKFLIILIFYIIMIFDNNKLNFGMANYIESSSSSIVMNDSNSNNNNTTSNRTVKKQLNDTNIPLSDNFNKNNKGANNKDNKNNLSLKNLSVQNASNTLMPTISAAKIQQHQQITTASTSTNDSNTSHIKNMKNIQDFDIPNSFRVGFYIFIGLGVIAVIFISCRSYRLKLSRAERRYGVQGDRRAQELIPLPVSIEDESDTEDHTLFDIHKQIRIS